MQTPRVAMWLAVSLALTLSNLSSALGSSPAQDAGPARARLPDESPILDWGNVWEAQHRAEKWVAAGAVSDAGSPIAVKGLVGVHVSLRWSGILLGEGQISGAELQTGSNGVVDLAICARDATQRALKQAQEHLTDAGNRFIVGQKIKIKTGPNDFALTLRNVGPLMTVDLQAAHSLEVIHIDTTAPMAAIYSAYVPMFHGLHLVHFGAKNTVDEAWLWPGQAVSENLDPSNQLLVLIARLGLSIEDAPRIGRPGGIDAQRFEVIQVVRPANELVAINAPPANLIRGNVVLPPVSLDSPGVERLSDRLAAHLLRQANSDGSFAGVYMPTRNDYDPALATDEDAALVVYALARRANYLESLDPSSLGAKSIRDVVRPGMAFLSKRFHDQGPEFPPAAASLMLMTLVESTQFADQKPLRDEVVGYLGTLRNPDGFYRNPVKVAGPGLGRANFSTQALILDALSHTYSITRDPILGAGVRQSLAAVWPSIQLENTIGSLPWLTDAQQVMEQYSADLPLFARSHPPETTQPTTQPSGQSGPPAPIDPYPGLRNVLKLLADHQISRPPSVGPADVVGGFEFGQHAIDAAPMADWRSAMAVHFIAMALRNPKLVDPADRIRWILIVGSGTRFLNQLMFEEPGTYYLRSPDQALGGVRLSVIDNKIAPPATATSLLATTQFQETLRSLSK